MIYTSIVLNTLGVGCLAIAVLSKARTHQSAAFVFGKFYDGTGKDGPGWSIRASPAYVAACGVLMSQYTILGYDASAHLCEETRKAVRDAPIGLLAAIAASCGVGFFVIVALLFSIQDFDTVAQSKLPVLTILMDTCGKGGGLVLMVLIMLCVWHCGLFSLVGKPNIHLMHSFFENPPLINFQTDEQFPHDVRLCPRRRHPPPPPHHRPPLQISHADRPLRRHLLLSPRASITRLPSRL